MTVGFSTKFTSRNQPRFQFLRFLVPGSYFSWPLVTKSLIDLFLILGIIITPIFVNPFPFGFTVLSSVISDVLLVLQIFCNTYRFSAYFLQYLKIFCIFSAYKFTQTSQGVDQVQIMSHRCRYCQKPFTRAGSKRHHERYTCWKRLENGQDKLPLVDLPSSTAITRVDAPKIILPTKKQNGIPNGIEMGEAFRFKTPSSIMIVGPSGCGKTCFTESLLLNHLEELFVNPPPKIHYCHGAWPTSFPGSFPYLECGAALKIGKRPWDRG